MKNKKPDYPASLKDILKRLWDGMRNGEFVSFRVSIKPRNSEGRVEEFSIEGRQSGSGRWDLHFPENWHSRAAESPEIIRQKLVQIERSVRDYIVGNAIDSQWEGIEASIIAAVQSERSIDDFLCRTELPIRAIARYGYDAHLAAPIMATACAIAAAKAVMDNDLSYATYCTDRGLFWSGHDVLISHPANRFKARASTGGEGKALRYEPVKDKVADLLSNLAPDGGWKQLPEAIDRVAVELITNHSEFIEKSGLTCNDLFRTIHGWIKRNPARFQCHIRSDA